jgi:hypothetical protein
LDALIFVPSYGEVNAHQISFHNQFCIALKHTQVWLAVMLNLAAMCALTSGAVG